MAIYFDYLANPVQWCDSSFDPTTNIMPFLAVKLQDWADKVGPNYADMVTTLSDVANSKEFTDGDWSDTTESCCTQIRLKGPDYRDGTLASLGSPPSQVLHFCRLASDRWYFYRSDGINDFIDPGGDRTDPANWTRQDAGYVSSADFDRSDLIGNLDNVFQTNDFDIAKPTYVLYSDTPGNRFFAWWVHQGTSSYMRAYVHELAPNNVECEECDLGWFLGAGSGTYPLYRYQSGERYYYRTSGPNFFSESSLGDSDDSSVTTINTQSMLLDYWGDYVGTVKDGPIVTQRSTFNPLWTYEYQGKKYMAWGENLLLPLE